MECCAGRATREAQVARDSISGGAAGELHADLRVTQLIADREVGAVASERGWGNNLPVVIMPGFMSSGLQVEDSTPCPEWNSERIWFSLQKLTASAARASGGGGAARKSAPIAATVSAKLRAQLIVTVHRGIELAAMDTNGKSDPYVRLELLDAEGRQLAGSGVRESRVVKGDLNPRWDQEIVFGGECPVCDAAGVQLTVLDKDFRADDIIGEIEIPIDPGAHRHKRRRPPGHGSMNVVSEDHVELVPTQQFPLVREGGRHVKGFGGFGEIVVSVVLHPAEMSAEELQAEGHGSDSETDSDDEQRGLSERLATRATKAKATLGDALDRVSVEATQHAAILQEQQLKALDKSTWLQHMTLQADGEADPEGIRVRSVPGLEGVNYLEQGNFVGRATTWVFAKVTDYLQRHGYEEERSLRAAPYDWRVPPQILEKRDGYFSRTVRMIEEMSRSNGGRPVVLMAHSMGNKMAHYFLKWVVVNERQGVEASALGLARPDGMNGLQWLDRYVHSFFAVAGPFLGSSKACRSTLSGEDMGLGAFLSHGEILTMSRNFGSAPWLMPTNDLAEAKPYHTIYFRKECTVTVAVLSVELTEALGAAAVEEAWVQVEYKKTKKGKTQTRTTRTKLVSAERGGVKLVFKQRFQFVAGKSLGQRGDDSMTFTLRGKSKGKFVKRAFQKRKISSDNRTFTSAGLGADTLSPVLGQTDPLTLDDLFGVKDEASVAEMARVSRRESSLSRGSCPTSLCPLRGLRC